MTRRLPDWRERLEAEVQRKALSVFAWGVNDCCLFACDLMRAMTGIDFAAAYRGRYGTQIGAARALREVDGVASISELLDLIAARDGWREIAPTVASSGDPVLAFATHGQTLGIRFGGFIATPGEAGVELIPATLASRAWAL